MDTMICQNDKQIEKTIKLCSYQELYSMYSRIVQLKLQEQANHENERSQNMNR